MGGEGQDKTHLPKRQMQEADTACWEPFSTLRLSKQLGKQDGVCCSPFHAATVDFLSTQFLALNEIQKHFLCGKLLRGTEEAWQEFQFYHLTTINIGQSLNFPCL